MCYKKTILSIVREGDKSLLEVIDQTIKKENVDPARRDRFVNTLLTDIAALTAANMIIRDRTNDDEIIRITPQGQEFIK